MPKIFSIENTKPRNGFITSSRDVTLGTTLYNKNQLYNTTTYYLGKGMFPGEYPGMFLVEQTKPRLSRVEKTTDTYYLFDEGMPMGLLLCLTYPSREVRVF